LTAVNWTVIGIISAVAVAAAAILFLLAAGKKKAE
jgi:hypothetical protein